MPLLQNPPYVPPQNPYADPTTAPPNGTLYTGGGQGRTYDTRGGFISAVAPEQLVSQQLTNLSATNNPLMEAAARRGSALAAQRGALNGSGWAKAATDAWTDSLLPVATADANRYSQVQDANQAQLNDILQGRERNRAQTASASISANASMHNNDSQIQAAARQAALNENWHRADTVMNNLQQTIFSDPSYWNNPDAAMGFFNEYGQGLQGLYSSLFPNEPPPGPGAH